MCYAASGILAILAISTLAYYVVCLQDPSDSELYLETPRTVVSAKILSVGYQYTGNCITKSQLAIVNFTTCSLQESDKLQCKDLNSKKYEYPEVKKGEVVQARRLRSSSSHHGYSKHTFHCHDKFVPWMKVRLHGSGLVRCAYRFGTKMASEERNWTKAQEYLNGHTADKFWVQSFDGNSCIVGFDDLNLLTEPKDVERGRSEIWTLWILLGVVSLISLCCAICMPDEPKLDHHDHHIEIRPHHTPHHAQE